MADIKMENINDCRDCLAIVLPSLDPDKKFAGVVNGLIEGGFKHIVIVDDGSSADNQKWFEKAQENPECTVIHHGVNKGKGRGLKTAFSYVLESMPEIKGVITIDGDGQHLLKDIIKCGEVMLANPDKVVLGCRDFNLPNVPPRSVAGNKFTSRMFKLLFGIELSDTQTGLRAIPVKYLDSFCNISGERFEYETNMLLQMKRDGIEFIEQPIETVYDEEDYSSHYNAFRDSYKVGKVMLKFLVTGSGFKFAISSGLAVLIDTLIYYILLRIFGLRLKLLFQIVSRIASSFVNFNMNRSFAFKSNGKYFNELGKYYALALPQAAVTFLLVEISQNLLKVATPGLATFVKVVIEAVIFFISYFIQKKWVFKKKKQ